MVIILTTFDQGYFHARGGQSRPLG